MSPSCIFFLQAFLSKYVDESAINIRRSQSEEENPPTPIPLDDPLWPTHKAASPARHGPMTPPISSNPHTPASPHPAGITQVMHHAVTKCVVVLVELTTVFSIALINI